MNLQPFCVVRTVCEPEPIASLMRAFAARYYLTSEVWFLHISVATVGRAAGVFEHEKILSIEIILRCKHHEHGTSNVAAFSDYIVDRQKTVYQQTVVSIVHSPHKETGPRK